MGGFGRSDLYRRSLLKRPRRGGGFRPDPSGALLDPVYILGLGKRLGARARIARSVGFPRALERRIAVDEGLMFCPLDRPGRWLVMKLGADRLPRTRIACAARRRSGLRAVNLLLQLRNLGCARPGVAGGRTAYQRQGGKRHDARSVHHRLQ